MKLVNNSNKSCCYFAFRSNLRSRWTSPAIVFILTSALPIVKPAACVGSEVPRAGKKGITGLLRTPVRYAIITKSDTSTAQPHCPGDE